MHRFMVDPSAVDAEVVTFSEPQMHQLRKVLRLRIGDLVRVFDGAEAFDLVVALSDARAGRIVERCPQPPEPRHAVSVYPALLQRDKFESVLQKLTEVGVVEVTPVLTERSLVREAPDAPRMARWQAILREATEQCGRGRVPLLQPAMTFERALRRAIAQSRTLLAFEGERHGTLRDALTESPERVSIFVGPEGGYAASEVALAQDLGAQVVTLGPRILRTETASPILAALVLYELGDLSSNVRDAG